MYWFGQASFTDQKSPLEQQEEVNPAVEIDQGVIQEANREFRRLPIQHQRSLSDHNLSSGASFSSDSQSPNSVLRMQKLQPILSGKEVTEEVEIIKEKVERERRRRRRKGSSKSLSDLEFEEVKGFMDLGFVFSAEDMDSSLVSIIPGLQRLGRSNNVEINEEEEKEEEETNSRVRRPYLSEAWGDKRKGIVRKPLRNWRFPAEGNEVDMKDHLRFWAHTVASTVR